MLRTCNFLWLALLLGAGPALADEILTTRAYYPEGPLFTDGKFYVAEMHRDRILTINDTKKETFYASEECGPTAIAPYQNGYIVLCHLSEELHHIGQTGALMEKFPLSEQAGNYTNPNDAAADDADGIYFTISGRFSLTAPAEGGLFYLNKDGAITPLASGLRYANGVTFDEATQTVFVSEHLAQRILRFPVIAPGKLGELEVFAELPFSVLEKNVRYEHAGPDGLETDSEGNLYVAYYGAGLVLALSPKGEILDRINIREQLTTNVALSSDEQSLLVTGSKISSRKPFPGKVREIVNPLAEQ